MLDLRKVCRLCLRQFEDFDKKLLFADDKITQMLSDFIKIQLNPLSRVPFKICFSCNDRLEEFQAFYRLANENQMKILDVLLSQRLDVTENCSQSHQTIPDEQIKVGYEVEVGDEKFNEDLRDSGPETTFSNQSGFQNKFLGSILTDMYENLSQRETQKSLSYFELFQNEENPKAKQLVQVQYQSLFSVSTHHVKAHNQEPKSYFQEQKSQYPEQKVFLKEENKPKIIRKQQDKDTFRRKSRCNECGVWVLNVKQHKLCVHSIENQKCSFCHRVFLNRLKLMMHINYKHKSARYNCKICGKSIKNRCQLKEHHFQKHSKGEFLYKCQWCNFKSNYRTSLLIHNGKCHPAQYKLFVEEKRLARYQPL